MEKVNIKLAGAVGHLNMYKLLKSKIVSYQDKINFTVYDGPNLCAWNGGRINRPIFITQEIIDWYNNNNIGVAFTFTNNVVDVTDEVGNQLLNMLNNNPLNAVICMNLELRDYVKDNHPNLKLIFSITGHPNSIVINDELIAHYKFLESKYDVVVPRFEMPLNEKFYTQLDTSKYEIITNDTCIFGCNIFREHLDKMSEINRTHKAPWKELGHSECFKNEECWIKNFDPNVGSERDRQKHGFSLGMDFNSDMYKFALSIGYKNFKIMGRELKSPDLKNDVVNHIDMIYKLL